MPKFRTNFIHFFQTKLLNVSVFSKTKTLAPLLTFVECNTMFEDVSKWKLDPLGPNSSFRFLTNTNCWKLKKRKHVNVNSIGKSSYFLWKKKFVDHFFSSMFFPWGLRDSIVACGTRFCMSQPSIYHFQKSRSECRTEL